MNRLYIDPNIARATTLDTAFYTTPAYLEAAKEKIFASSWQFLGSSELANLPAMCNRSPYWKDTSMSPYC